MKRWLTQSLMFGVIVAAAAVTLSLVSPAKAQAYCGVDTNKESSMAGAIVEMYWWPYTGGTLEARGVNAHIWASDSRGDSDGFGNIIKLNLSGNRFSVPPPQSSNDMTFQQYNSGCGDGYNVVLGYDASSPNTSGDWGPWVLDCDSSQFGVGNERIFTVTGSGVPQGARGGGSWEVKSFRANNGGTVHITLAYSEPAPPPTVGTVDVVNCSTVAGWAFDPNNSGASLTIHVYYGGPAGSGAPGVAHSANLSRPDVNSAYGIGGNHGFNFANDYPNATSATTVYVYALSTTGGGNSLIGAKAYGPCTHAATVTPSTSVSPTGWANPSQTLTFTHVLTTSNYGGINHNVGVSEYRRVDTVTGTGAYTLVTNGSTTVTGNGAKTLWARAVPVPAGATQVCEQLVVTNGGGATVTGSPSAACVGIRSGSTTPVVQANPAYIPQGGSSTITGALVTSGFRGNGYPVTCSYTLVKTTPAGAASTVASASCSKTITANDAPNGTTFYTYNYNSGTDPIGTSVCLTINVTAGDFTKTPTARGCTVVIAQPYFRALGGDVVAGAGYLTSTGTCPLAGSSGQIKSWNNLNASGLGNFGAATELAALATGSITNFYAATLADTGANTLGSGGAPSNLSFANTATPPGGIGNLQCMPDYAALASGSTNPAPQTITDLSGIESLASGTYKISGNQTLGNIALPANNGRNITLVVEGSVYINGNIKYSPASPADISKIPRFTLITKGNIYIGNNVSELHGAYIAETGSPSAGNGTVYTCAVIAGTTADVSNSYANCGPSKPQLTIYGAVAANNLNLGRSFGSLASKQQAETFWFTPELWIGGGANTDLSNTGYDSITSLPPTL